MAYIPAGSFTMGNCMDPSEGDPDELPLHTVYVSAFYIEKTLVTKERWDPPHQYAILRGYHFDYPGAQKAAGHPFHTVSWFDVVKWCNARSQLEGRTPCYYTDSGLTSVYTNGQVAPYVNWSANGYRLPTEAEWEKAARGGLIGSRFPWGLTITDNQANYYAETNAFVYDISVTQGYNPAYTSGGIPYTSPVGSFQPNGFGLFDMAGNIWEWCWDWYDSGWYSNAGATQNDTRGPASGTYREVRGGCWPSPADQERCANRVKYAPAEANYTVGFRCVRGP